MTFRRESKGFTLIELMVTVAIVGILASIAVPSYVSYLRRGKIAEATATLADYKIKLEQYYQDNRNYGSTAAACGVIMPASPAVKYFIYTCNWGTGATPDNQSFLMTATGLAAEGMSGYVYTIDESNNKTSTLPGVAQVSCWISKAGEAC